MGDDKEWEELDPTKFFLWGKSTPILLGDMCLTFVTYASVQMSLLIYSPPPAMRPFALLLWTLDLYFYAYFSTIYTMTAERTPFSGSMNTALCDFSYAAP